MSVKFKSWILSLKLVRKNLDLDGSSEIRRKLIPALGSGGGGERFSKIRRLSDVGRAQATTEQGGPVGGDNFRSRDRRQL
ncbi:PGR5-like protein 1A [Corchorus olitorius]|uniref:PGR5-like protein 1A n=1 Tax=Corchorus olitorius TaxID=93759 RepID=A0A1R3HI47_9ROSI|nr:PGR5-like protein 1A [Corchorus olitorius]